jgi:DNA-binding CsgD family transcriptional regulator
MPRTAGLDSGFREGELELATLSFQGKALPGMTPISAEERVIEALARSGGGISTPEAIAAELGLNAKTISNHFTPLHKKSRVELLGNGRWRILLSKKTGVGKQFAFRCWRHVGSRKTVSLIE